MPKNAYREIVKPVLQKPFGQVDLGCTSIPQGAAKNFRPIGSLFAHLAPCPGLLLPSVGTSCHERVAFSDRSPPQSERRRQVARRPREGGRPIWSRLTRGRRGNMAGGLYLLTPARGAPRPCTGQPPFVLAVLCCQQQNKGRPQGAG